MLVGLIVRIVMGDPAATYVRDFVTGLGLLFLGGNAIFHDNVVFWSVVVEVQLYAIYLAIRMVAPRGRPFPLVGWTVAFVAFGLLYHAIEPQQYIGGPLARILDPRFFAPARMGEWLLGAVAADWILRRGSERPIARATGVTIAAAALAFVVGVRVITKAAGVDQYSLDTLDAIGFALLVWALASLESRRAQQPHTPHVAASTGPAPRRLGDWASVPAQWVAAVGHRSYSIYLLHFLVLQYGLALGIRWFFPSGTVRESLLDSGAGVTLIAATVVVTFIATEVNYRLVELPSHRLARRLGRRLAR